MTKPNAFFEKVMREQLNGFHQYRFGESIRLEYVSQNLCRMLGYEQAELLSDDGSLYVQAIYACDREGYLAFLREAAAELGNRTFEYRMVKKDGGLIFFSDTIVTVDAEDGTRLGISILTDITHLKTANENLRFLNETMSCGFLKYTCEKQPKITYINDHMLEILHLKKGKDGEIDYLELYRQNIYFMIPMEERRRFALYLNRVYTYGAPLAGEIIVQRADGTKGCLFGWVTKTVNEQGQEEFQSVCMDISERYYQKKSEEISRYLQALTDVYDMIFEYDLAEGTVKCLYGEKSSMFKWLQGIPMQMKEATEKWIDSTVFEEDKETVRRYFENLIENKFSNSASALAQIDYRALSSRGQLETYSGIVIKIEENLHLFCCRNKAEQDINQQLINENKTLKNMNENMQGFVMQFTEGVAAFEIKEGMVTPLYGSGNVYQFFGVTEEEWVAMMKQKNPIKDFIARSPATYEAVNELLKNGEAEFTYFDLNIKTERRIKAICSQRSADGSETRYIMLYNLDRKTGENKQPEKKPVYIRTFGYFDVFVGERSVAFRSEKAKELLALLVDRRGGYISSDEAISFLWPEEPASAVTLSRYRKVALRLKNILEEYGIADIVESVDGKRRIAGEKVQCDLYDYLTGKEEFAPLFKGSYLSNYSWGESTLGELTGKSLF